MKSHITNNQCHNRGFRYGFTIIELLASITIIGILTAIIIPAVQQAREAGRRVSCSNNLHQIGIAIHDYEAIHRVLPSGAWTAPGIDDNLGLLAHILPQMEQKAVYDKLLLSKTPESRKWLLSTAISAYACPSDSETLTPPRVMGTNYAGNFGAGVQKLGRELGYNGTFQHDGIRTSSGETTGRIRFRDITDGLSNTAMVSEILTSGGPKKRLWIVWRTPEALPEPHQLEEFASACAAMGLSSEDKGDIGGRGRPWYQGYIRNNFYNHILIPNQPSCTNGGGIPTGAYTAVSMHSGGVNVLYADGTVRFTSEGITLDVWRATGTRNGGESF